MCHARARLTQRALRHCARLASAPSIRCPRLELVNDDVYASAHTRSHTLTHARSRYAHAHAGRITLAIEFSKPDLLLREKIWRSMAPPKLPLAEDVDFMLLARK
jgi:hypothetical protein